MYLLLFYAIWQVVLNSVLEFYDKIYDVGFC